MLSLVNLLMVKLLLLLSLLLQTRVFKHCWSLIDLFSTTACLDFKAGWAVVGHWLQIWSLLIIVASPLSPERWWNSSFSSSFWSPSLLWLHGLFFRLFFDEVHIWEGLFFFLWVLKWSCNLLHKVPWSCRSRHVSSINRSFTTTLLLLGGLASRRSTKTLLW